MSSGTDSIADEARQQRTWDVEVQLAAPASADEVAQVVERLPGIARVEGFNVVQTGVAGPGRIPFSRTYPDQGHDRVWVTALPAPELMGRGSAEAPPPASGDAPLFPEPALLEGRWLEPGETGAIVLNQVTLANADAELRTGDTVDLSLGGGANTTWRIVGIAEERSAASRGYVTAEGLAAATGQPLAANALRIAIGQHDVPWVVLADPEGAAFSLSELAA